MVNYFDGFKHAEYGGYKFTRDDRTGYFLSTVKIGDRRKRLHVYVYERERGRNVPAGYQVHHIDENKNNNEIENLACIPEHYHLSYHSKKNAEENREQLVKALDAARNAATEWHRSKEGRQWHKAHYEKMKSALREKHTFKCRYCGRDFIGIREGFCCDSHKTAYRNKSGVDDEPRKCEICGKWFIINKYRKTKTCSRECATLKRMRTTKEATP